MSSTPWATADSSSLRSEGPLHQGVGRGCDGDSRPGEADTGAWFTVQRLNFALRATWDHAKTHSTRPGNLSGRHSGMDIRQSGSPGSCRTRPRLNRVVAMLPMTPKLRNAELRTSNSERRSEAGPSRMMCRTQPTFRSYFSVRRSKSSVRRSRFALGTALSWGAFPYSDERHGP